MSDLLVLGRLTHPPGLCVPRQLGVCALVVLWGGRLTLNFVSRGGIGHEDWRYTAMRSQFGAHFWWVSLFSVFRCSCCARLCSQVEFGIAGLARTLERCNLCLKRTERRCQCCIEVEGRCCWSRPFQRSRDARRLGRGWSTC